jgi:hypothetical protein
MRLTCVPTEIVAEDWNYFGAFCVVRDELERLGLRPWCYGASRNCYPSRMALDMGDGRLVYKMQPRVPASETVSIFDVGDDVDPVTTSEQRAFYNEWLDSLNRQKDEGFKK